MATTCRRKTSSGRSRTPISASTVQTTTYDDDVLTGNRPYNWQGSLQLQQQLWSGVALNVGYFRTWYGNFRATDNRAVTPQDFTPYCVTAPLNALLPGGGGNQICGLYDVVPTQVRPVEQSRHAGGELRRPERGVQRHRRDDDGAVGRRLLRAGRAGDRRDGRPTPAP